MSAPGSLLRLLLAVPLVCGTACPRVSDVTPDPAAPGAEVTIRGEGFGFVAKQVLYDGTALAVRSWTAVEILATLPAGKPAGTYRVTVDTWLGPADGTHAIESTVEPAAVSTSATEPPSGAGGA